MKTTKVFWISAAAIALLVAAPAVFIWAHDGRVYCNRYQTGVLLRKPHYRSWSIVYSYGAQFQPDGTVKNFWHAPKFRHIDISKIPGLQPAP